MRERPVPRAVEGGERVPAIFRGKGRHAVGGGVKSHFQRGRVRLQQHVGNDGLAGQVRALAGMAGIFVVAHVIPGPAVESALLHARDVIRHQIVAQAVALIGGDPQIARVRIHRQPHAVADARRKGAQRFAALRDRSRECWRGWFPASQAAPRPCSASQRRISSAFFLPMPSATLEPDPTEMNMRLPSREKRHVARGVSAAAVTTGAGR